MNATTPADSNEILHELRGLSHDMGAAHMLLEHSFRRLKALLTSGRSRAAAEADPGAQLSQVDACIRAAKGYLDDLTRLSTSGVTEMEPEPVELADVLATILMEQAPLLDERGVQVCLHEPLPVFWCHPVQLKQVVTNLLRNAVLHGCDPKRPRVIFQTCAPPDGDDSLAAVRIHDNGSGIDPRCRREIFLPGRRLENTQSSGSGWGLPASRRIAERFGGSLILDTDCRYGTAFILILPDASDAIWRSAKAGHVEEGREWRLQLDARHQVPLRHEHSQLANDARRMTSAE